MFAAYLQNAHAAINALEEDLDELWLVRLRELERREAALRDGLIALVVLWPFDSKGRLRRKTAELRAEIRSIRLRAERLVDEFRDGLLESFSGHPQGWRQVPQSATRTYFETTRHLHIYRSAVRAQQSSARAEAMIRLIEGTEAILDPNAPPPAPPDAPAGPDLDPNTIALDITDTGLPPGIDLEREAEAASGISPADAAFEEEHAKQIRKITRELTGLFGKPARVLAKLQELTFVNDSGLPEDYFNLLRQVLKLISRGIREDFVGELDDLIDLTEAALDNPEGNIEDRARQIREKLRDISTDRTITRQQVIQEINGVPRQNATRLASAIPAGVKLNRNNMRLSIQAHARAAFRQQWQAWAERMGIDRFMLEYPVSRRISINPAGAIAQHAHQIRTADEWADIYRAAGAKKFSTGTSLLGLHHGDFSILVPIPERLLAEATDYSKRSRGRLLSFLARRSAA